MRVGDWDIDGFEWDQGNELKILQKHGIEASSVESIYVRPLDVAFDQAHSRDEPRYLCVGEDASGRAMLVVFTLRNVNGKLFLRPISARRMHGKERGRHV